MAEEHRTDKQEAAQTLKQFAEGFFSPGCHGWIERKTAKNKTYASDFLEVDVPYFQ